MWDFDDYTNEYNEARERVRKTLRIGAEYSDRKGELFGVFLKEMSGELPYRISWYDKFGFSGHAEIRNTDDAVDTIIEFLGAGVQPSPGSLQHLFVNWEPVQQRQAKKTLQAIDYSDDEWEAFDQWSQLVHQIVTEALEKLQGPFEQIADLDADYMNLVDKHGVPDKLFQSQGTAVSRAGKAYLELMNRLKEV